MWHGSTDLRWLLQEIGGWVVDCENHDDHRAAVAYAKHQGWIGTRTHYAPVFPEGVEAFEVTDAGFEQLASWGRSTALARQLREWHRMYTSRCIGYYWVKLGEQTDWEIMEYLGGSSWRVFGCENTPAVIGPRVELPSDKKRPIVADRPKV